ncbi:phosphonate metabolism protein/1,5-bisphosphokinase (PRPP-forming) PhnN [Arthrobacter sp. M4]|uniref:phosphonate metabolism protein/1,5-bisphosphokinase (PRPP-forming) PhnN n=1 Tax=Arthrobacter sp. M4 TaxID=218160 RepID=UPI001CDCA9D1|nr:phosphonate metabolism protein/1,5-bisphosphokinase (PRPP-forming) PhnN [Arthrobacter sp. M4]MCA4132579.1 phosphonate metabolism protein/1,5-bisphosphokinase (PRPP-forming) PhnN [Arthrobacter sp. M4]
MTEGMIGPGAFVAVVGPSGVGKDALICEARRHACPHISLPKRHITRAPGPGEDHVPTNEDEFQAARGAGMFALTWDAHDLQYGIPKSIDDDIRTGRAVVVNVSRSVIGTLAARYERLIVVRVTVSEEVRAARMRCRGRENADEISKRLRRPDPAPESTADKEIRNDGTIAEGGAKLLRIIEAAAGGCCRPPGHRSATSQSPIGPGTLPEAGIVHDGSTIADSVLGRYTEVGQGSRLAHVEFGDYSYCDRYSDLANTTVGKFSNIASFVRAGATDHPLDRATLHHFVYRSEKYWPDAEDDADWFAKRRARRTVIGHDTWIGHGAQIKPDVVVGNGAVVASGAIVTRDVPPYAIVAGVPAKIIRFRQPPEVVHRLEQLAWWDWDHETLRQRLSDFRSLDAIGFLNRYER